MNKLDIHFKNLITSLKVLSPDAIFDNIKTKYLQIDDYNKNAIEKFLAQFNYWGKLNYAEGEFEELKYSRYTSITILYFPFSKSPYQPVQL